MILKVKLILGPIFRVRFGIWCNQSAGYFQPFRDNYHLVGLLILLLLIYLFCVLVETF